MQEIVKYHNDFNKIKLPSFTEQEQNILMGIIAKIRENPEGEIIEFTPQELLEFSTENLTRRALGDAILTLKDKFFKADFTMLIKKNDRVGKATINLFRKFILWYEQEDIERNNLLSVELQVNSDFAYLVNELTSNFTRFELTEFIALSGKYTKTLYRLLKQYRATGTRLFKWDEFVEIMDIPEKLKMCDIDKDILKPALKELTKERNLFDQRRIPFENLTYTKLDKNQQPNPRGRNKVCFIKFQWKRQEPVELEAEITKSMYVQFAEKYKGRTFYFQNFGNFEFLGLGKNEAGEKIFIFQNENGRISTKLEQLPKQHDLDKLAKNIIN